MGISLPARLSCCGARSGFRAACPLLWPSHHLLLSSPVRRCRGYFGGSCRRPSLQTRFAWRAFPVGSLSEMLAKQTEFAKKAFDMTLQNTRDIAELDRKST